MNKLIAGIAGFLGSNLSRAEIKRGHKVYGIDDFSTGDPKNIPEECEVVCDDVSNIAGHFNGVKFDEIYHLASIATPYKYQEQPLKTALANSFGTFAMLNLAQENKAKFFYASTSEIYGDPKVHPQDESYYGNVNPYGPRSCYDESKRFGETLCYIYKDIVDVRVARLFNTYGPFMSPTDGRVLTNFIQAAKKNETLVLNGGFQTRSFCYVDDTIRGIQALMEKGDNTPHNIGNSDEYSMDAVADIILEMIPESDSRREHIELPLDDPMQRKPDIAKMYKLGWKPKYTLREGISEWLKSEE